MPQILPIELIWYRTRNITPFYDTLIVISKTQAVAITSDLGLLQIMQTLDIF